ncbi:ScyD/ScyE family protein [Brasilonema bromeliae]|uniref:ScyD/ScyE family protein n=1 Tax=Brasilonema bromeliae SPC951 TaxID=385972 RepID=A0ABX1P2E6_9CYAN|nr:ScyD/ScyE family protein [Brasilonema bromeliae]NMG18501.1 ScyD/ScyE family protein [Brasilonema bromeliae SPC951]
MRLSLVSKSAISFAALTFCFAAVFGTKPATAASFSVVAEGLDNVRGLNFGPDGSLYITESGVGGNGRCIPGPSLDGTPSCAGTTGAVTRVKDGKQERVLTGLPSTALRPIGSTGEGPQDIQFDAAGNPYLLIGYGGNPTIRDFPENSPSWGQLYRVDFQTASLTSIADFAKYELANNPDGVETLDFTGEIASNAYAFTIKGNTAYVVDAAANDILTVGLDGSNLKTFTVLPKQTITNPIFPTPAPGQESPPDAPPPGQTPQEVEIQSVPTGAAFGPDGALYVSEYTGFPFPVGKARIFRVGSNGEVTVYADGFTQLSDLEFDAQGNLYTIQYSNAPQWLGVGDASLIQISPDGTRTTLLSGNGLESATALTVGPDGAVYVSSKGDRPGVGQVLRVDPKAKVPEPSVVVGAVAFGVLGLSTLHKRKPKRVVLKK